MDTKQIEYIVKIADEKSITRAAEKLFITQSALSQQLQKLEEELNTRLFIRNKSDWMPTPEGEVYLENAREILRIKKRAYSVIADMAYANKNYLSIGMTPGRGPDMFTHIYPLFHQKHPLTTVEPRELSVKKQQEEIRKGNLDLGFMTLLDSQRTIDTYIDLVEEELFIGIPKDYPLPSVSETLNEDYPEFYPEINLNFFHRESFVLVYKESTVRMITDRIFENACFTPNILFETSSIHTVLSMIQANLCVGLIPYHYVRQKPEGIKFLRMPDHPRWKVCTCYRKNSYLSRAAKTFIELVKEYWTT
ncbi:MAG: LysR family transcriptional regulator [Eubacteriales bacterium]|nr:LysR family transcriptional regulator [Eubacteriales bacterium]